MSCIWHGKCVCIQPVYYWRIGCSKFKFSVQNSIPQESLFFVLYDIFAKIARVHFQSSTSNLIQYSESKKIIEYWDLHCLLLDYNGVIHINFRNFCFSFSLNAFINMFNKMTDNNLYLALKITRSIFSEWCIVSSHTGQWKMLLLLV